MAGSVERILDYLGEGPQTAAGALPVGGKTKVANATTSVRAPKLASAVVGRLADRLSVSQETVLIVSDIKLRTFHRRQEKREALTEAESDRIMRIARVAEEAERVFGSGEKSKRWLSTDNRILGARPLDLLATDAGSRDVENELVRIDYGDFA